jgi:hypothetical protein
MVALEMCEPHLPNYVIAKDISVCAEGIWFTTSITSFERCFSSLVVGCPEGEGERERERERKNALWD